MPQQVRTRKQVTVPFSANNRKSQPLGRGMIYREIMLRLTGAPTLTAANNTTAKTLNGDEWACVSSIELVANGTDVIKSISGNNLWWLNYFLYKTPPKITAALGDAGTANVPFDSVLILPLWMVDTLNPMDTALDSRTLSSLEIVITWGDYTSINASATAWTTEPQIEVFSMESFGVKGPFSNWRLFEIQKTIDATNSKFQIDLPVSTMYRGFLISATDAGVNQADIINNIKLVSGSTVFYDQHAQDDVLPQVTALQRGMQKTFDIGGGAYDDLRKSDQASLDGIYWVELAPDQKLVEAVDALGFSELKLEFDVTVGGGTTLMNVVPLQIVPVRGANR